VGVIEQLADVRNETITQTLTTVCNLLPFGLIRLTCQETLTIYGPTLIDMLGNYLLPPLYQHLLSSFNELSSSSYPTVLQSETLPPTTCV
jgi:hypothetical protein